MGSAPLITATVASLLCDLRDALIALVPIAERAGIVWTGPAVYDPWENIERTFYMSFVVAFVGLATQALPFDSVEFAVLDAEWAAVGGTVVKRFSECAWLVFARDGAGLSEMDAITYVN